MSWLLVLDDDPVRLRAFEDRRPALGSEWRIKAWTSAERMLAELDVWLPQARFISLDGGLSPPVAETLAMRAPTCPIALGWRGRSQDAAKKSFARLAPAGWRIELVRYL